MNIRYSEVMAIAERIDRKLNTNIFLYFTIKLKHANSEVPLLICSFMYFIAVAISRAVSKLSYL